MFFCQQDPITKDYMPDLEPIKVTVRQLEYEQSEAETPSSQVLISPFIGLSTLTHYISTNAG